MPLIESDLIVGVDDLGHDVKFFGATSGRYMEWDESQDSLRLRDNVKMKVGNDGDLQMWHDGSNTYLSNEGVGHVYIQNTADDKDIIFKSDDGSGGTAEYIRIDGGAGYTIVSKTINWLDGKFATWGTGGDLQIHHDGSNSYISQGGTGDLIIRNITDDADIRFKSDDGAGAVTTYFYLDGSSAAHDGSATTALHTVWPDNSRISIGSGRDLQLHHTGSTSKIQNYTGNLEITNQVDDGDILLKSDDGSGGVATYFSLDGGISSLVAYRDLLIATDGTNGNLKLGAGQDLVLNHDGTDSKITNSTGDLYIDNGANDKDIIFKGTDNSGDITALTLDMSDAGTAIFNHNVKLPDSGQLNLGGSGDLSLLHDGTDGYITEITGDLKIRNSANDKDIIFQSDDGSGGIENYIQIDGSEGRTLFNKHLRVNDSVELQVGASADLKLFHNGSNSFIQNDTGDLFISNFQDDGDIEFRSDDGSGSIATYFALDGGLGYTTVQKDIRFNDSVELLFGTDSDFKIKHSGSDGFIRNFVGDLYVLNAANNKDIIFQSDDGSGGTETYFFLDGSLSSGNPFTVFPDDSILTFGNSQDLQIKHSSSYSYIDNTAGGDLVIRQFVDDKDIIFQNDDGSGGLETYFFLDGSTGHTQFPDAKKLQFGSSNDMFIEHDGSNSYISSDVGTLYIRQTLNDGDLVLTCDDGSGGNTAYITLDGSASLVQCHVDLAITTGEFIRDASNSNKYIQLSDGSANVVYSAYAKHVWRTYDGSAYGDRVSITNTGELEAPRRKFAKTSNTDGDHDGDVVYFGSTTSMTTGAIYHYKSDGTWELADADSAATCDGLLGIALGAASNTNGVLLRGMVTLDHDPGAVGDVLFVSTTAGDTTATAPSGSGDIVRVIGYCLHASSGMIYFNPDGTFVEVA